MSHFYTLVIVDKESGRITEDDIEPLLAPYSEHLEVPEYDRKCYCIGQIASAEAMEQVTREMGNINDIRNQFHADHPLPEGMEVGSDAFWAHRDELDKIWEKEFGGPRSQRIEELISQNPLKDQPDPDCSECHGTGTYRSTYNPNSKWDWWVMGGRWGDISPRQRLANEFLDNIPFAIVTPEGQWLEKGSMGWFGFAHGEKDDWKDTAISILNEYANCMAVVCDLHI